jgi:uncharacterized membrane protein
VAQIVSTIDIDRSAEDVFEYLDDLARHNEWQEMLVSTRVETEGPVRVGTRAVDTRRVGGSRTQDSTYEIVEHDPPRRAVFRGVDGPVRPIGGVTVEPLDEGRSRVTVELDLKGHGLLGAVLAPIARSQARKQVPKDQETLKRLLETPGG